MTTVGWQAAPGRGVQRGFQLARPLVLLVLALAGTAGGCSDDAAVGLDTGLMGTVLRGPTQPVCRIDDPCEDEPFAALFHVERSGHTVTQFTSGEDGAFSVPLAPGDYVVVPDAGAPIIGAEQQRKDVRVGPSGFTEVVLSFDTGIR